MSGDISRMGASLDCLGPACSYFAREVANGADAQQLTDACEDARLTRINEADPQGCAAQIAFKRINMTASGVTKAMTAERERGESNAT